MANERLRGAIIESGLTLEQVAERLGVSAKTVERWINEPKRQPYRRFKYAAASLLQCEMSYLWPEERTSAEVTEAGNAELVKLYPHRSVVPNRLWPQLYAGATRHFDVLVYSGFWLTEDAAFHQVVKEKSAAGCSDPVHARGPRLRCGRYARGRRGDRRRDGEQDSQRLGQLRAIVRPPRCGVPAPLHDALQLDLPG